MKTTAVYIEDGFAQLALTPESDFERNALKSMYEVAKDGLVIKPGSFYHCQGGWARHGGEDDKSYMLVAVQPRT